MKMVTRLLVLIGLLLASLSGPAHATKVRRLTLAEINQRADAVVLGVVTAISTRADAAKKMVWTDYTITVEETLRGSVGTGIIRISFAGGSSDGLDVGIVGIPRLEQGERYVLFLYPQSTLASATVGWGQGIYRVVETEIGDQQRRVLISYNQEPLQLDSEGRLLRGSPMTVENGQLRVREVEQAPRAAEPTVLDAQGNPIPQPPQVAPAPAPSASERTFATVADLQSFLRGERQQAPGKGK